MMFGGFVFAALVVALIAYFLGWRPRFTSPRDEQSEERALEILKQRYARGEISRSEYREMREEIESR